MLAAKTLRLVLIFEIFFNAFCVSETLPFHSANPWIDDYRAISGLENYKSWGTYNVHDPSCLKIGDTYYMYSTDAIYSSEHTGDVNPDVKTGFIQVRTSKDLVHWKFMGWAFDKIPEDARNWVLEHSNNKGASNIWAPYILQFKHTFRLYFCVSAFGLQTSYIGMAVSSSPLGPWKQKGCVVKTKKGDLMNAIDPTLVTDVQNGKMWMYYGSYFGGLYVVEINPETGFTMTPNDQGHNIARRANMRKDNIEAAEIVYQPKFKKYYLFMSYGPLMTTYNVRVGRADKPEGPFFDFFGHNLLDTINHFPILTHSYRFENHPGWAGTGHCSVFCNGEGVFFMAHQGRLAPDNQLMDLHVREIKWTDDGWPVVSPERYTASAQTAISEHNLQVIWEVIRIADANSDRKLEYGQILWGENRLHQNEMNRSVKIELCANHQFKGDLEGKWFFTKKNGLDLQTHSEQLKNILVFVGHDWENQTETFLFTGLDKNGCSVWGKKIQ